MKRLDPCNAAYLAGLIDADGTVTLTRKHRNENRHVAVSISNTDRNLLSFVVETVGAGKITSKRTTRKNHSPSFVFAIYNRQALQLLEWIHPFLRTYKAKRAALILRDYISLTPRNGKYNREMRMARDVFAKAVLAIRPWHGSETDQSQHREICQEYVDMRIRFPPPPPLKTRLIAGFFLLDR